MPEAIFDVVAEDPEEEHVAEEVPPAAVQEHRREDGEPVEPRRHDAVACKNCSSAASGSDCSKRNATLLRTMKATVKRGNVRDGMTSRSGIMRPIVTYNSGPDRL